MAGYPQMKSELFRATAGTTAFHIFSAAGQMRHPLNEAIPGAPALQTDLTTEEAFAQLQQRADSFIHFRQRPRPHFDFGDLSLRSAACTYLITCRPYLPAEYVTEKQATAESAVV